jgi:hypothetical protein
MEKKASFSTRIPEEQKTYLNEMAWRTRSNVSAYLTKLIAEDMAKHPEWKESVDELNTDKLKELREVTEKLAKEHGI